MTAEDGADNQMLRRLAAREVVNATYEGEDVVLVGTVPSGYTAIICNRGWQTLRRWKLTTLRVSKGSLYAAGKGRAAGFAAARFLANAPRHQVVRHRNGNPFDIRLSNILVIPRGHAQRHATGDLEMGPG